MLSFIQWMEQTLGGGLEPPKQDPTKVGGTNSFGDYHGQNSEELPPTKVKKKKAQKISINL